MARSRRPSAGQARRTNWIGNWMATEGFLATVAPGAFQTTEIFFDNSAELNNYVAPTLTRLRGSVELITDVAATVGPHIVRAYVVIWVGRAVGDIEFTTTNDALSDDSIIWAGSWCDRWAAALVGASGGYAYGGMGTSLAVDSKSQRKLEDTGKLWATIYNSTSSSTTVRLAWMLRMLLKE